jgi:hypothetical protein
MASPVFFLQFCLFYVAVFQFCVWRRLSASFCTLPSHLLCGLPTSLFALKLPPEISFGMHWFSILINVACLLQSLYLDICLKSYILVHLIQLFTLSNSPHSLFVDRSKYLLEDFLFKGIDLFIACLVRVTCFTIIHQTLWMRVLYSVTQTFQLILHLVKDKEEK